MHAHWTWCVLYRRRAGAGKSTPALSRGLRELILRDTKLCWTQADKKSFVVMEQGRPCRKPPLVGKDKSPKAFELTSVKELDKRAL